MAVGQLPQEILSVDGPIRILFLIAQFDTGGAQNQLFLRLKYLDKALFKPHVAVLTGGKSFFEEEIRKLGLNLEFLHIESENSLSGRVAKIRKLIRKIRPDVVHSLLGWDNTYGNLAATLEKVPTVIAELLTVREVVKEAYPRHFLAFEKLALKYFCDTIVCCSVAAQKSYLSAFGSFERKSTVIVCGIDPSSLEDSGNGSATEMARQSPHEVVVGTLGRLVDVKDHETFVRAARIVCDRFPSTRFTIGGYGPLKEKLERLILDLDLDRSVKIAFQVPDANAFYDSMDIFVMTSRWEGFPVVLMEAQARGRSAVATRVGGIPEMVEDGVTGLLCKPGDAAGIACAISRLVEDRKLREEMGRRGRERVKEKYCMQALIKEWEALYRDCATAVHGQIPKPPRQGKAPRPAWQPEEISQDLDARAKPAARNVVVFRLCPVDRFVKVVEDVRAACPGSILDCVVQSDVSQALSSRLPDVRMIEYGGGRFSAWKWIRRAVTHQRKGGYDLAVVPLNTGGSKGYFQAEFCALISGRGRALFYEAWSDEIKSSKLFGWRGFCLKWARRTLRGGADILESAFVLINGIRLGWKRNSPASGRGANVDRGKASITDPISLDTMKGQGFNIDSSRG